jgi:IMP and pyridine-specific 5'-nucleotidase
MAINAHGRYSQIMKDVEELILDHIAHQQSGTAHASKLKLLVPSVGTFFTALPLQDAFNYQDAKRCISSRRFVPPSFNDIRLVLNTAQAMSIVRKSKLELVTFDGDVTLYDDGESLTPDNPVIPRILDLLRNGTRIGIVTAAGYLEAHKYYERLYGLLDAVASSDDLREQARNRLVVMGGEANFLFTYTPDVDCKLQSVPKADWQLPEMQSWTEENVTALLDVAERALKDCVHTMRLPVSVLRKERAVGIYPSKGIKLAREQLEETVLVTQRILVSYPRAFLIKSIILTIPNRNSPKPANASPSAHSTVSISSPFKPTQTNLPQTGGNDIFVDIGDKSWGVMACQQYFGGIEGGKSLHVGDQFLSAGANDFKARLASTTAWIANPAETVYLLDEIAAMQ